MPRRGQAVAAAVLVVAALGGCSSSGEKGAPASTGGDPTTSAPSPPTTTAGAAEGYGPPVLLGRLDPEVDESSGLAALPPQPRAAVDPQRLWRRPGGVLY